MGTVMLSVLAGHWRYAHINAIRGDEINPGLLGMDGIVSLGVEVRPGNEHAAAKGLPGL